MAGTIKRIGSRMRVWDVTLTAATGATTATGTSDDAFSGIVRKVEIDPGTLTASATLKGYEANTPLATGTRDHFVDYTVPSPAVELVLYPMVAAKEKDGTAADPTQSLSYVVCDNLKLDLASATAADSVRVRVYVEV